MKNKIAVFTITAIVAFGAGFFGGVQYGKWNALADISRQGRGFAGQNFSPEELQARLGQFGRSGAAARNGGQVGGGFVAGEIIGKDDKSITVKLQGGGSKIVFFSQATKVTKTAEGTASDLAVRESVVISGTMNQDGSITAQSVQIRSALPQAQQ